MKNSLTHNREQNANIHLEQQLSYSFSPTKITKGSQYGGGDKTFANSLKNQNETLYKKNKVLEDEQHKLQTKIKQVK